MSDRLDDDVLLLILDELATPSPDYDVYCANKVALYNVCLASHRLRRLAQPHLWHQIWVVERWQAVALESFNVVQSLGERTIWFTVGKNDFEDSLPEAVQMARVLPNVEKLLLSGSWRPDSLAHIESFSKLRHLTLVNSGLGGVGIPFTAPVLEELTIHRCSAFDARTAEWLKPRSFPALRVLSVVLIRDSHVGRLSLDMVVGSDMINQLDVLQLARSGRGPRSSLALEAAFPVLIFAPPDDGPAGDRHSLGTRTDMTDELGVAAVVRRLADKVERVTSSLAPDGLRAIIIPVRVLSLAAQHKNVADAVRRLEQACGPQVRMNWLGEAGTDRLRGVPREVVRYARELRAAQRLSRLDA